MSTNPLIVRLESDIKLGTARDIPSFTGSITLHKDSAGIRTSMSLRVKDNKGITVTQLIEAISGNKVTLPEFVDNVALRQFSIIYHSGQSTLFELIFESTININNKDIAVTLNYHSAKQSKENQAAAFSGIIQLDGHIFTLSFAKGGNVANLAALYQNQSQQTLSLQAVLNGLNYKNTDIPNIQISVKDFKALLIYAKEEGTSRMLFGMGAGIGNNFNLNELPLIGKLAEQNKLFSLESISVLYASALFKAEQINGLKAVNASLSSILPDEEINTGFSLWVKAKNGDQSRNLLLSTQQSKKASEKQLAPAATDKSAIQKNEPTRPQDGATKWFDVNYKAGPIKLQRVGLSYDKGQVIFLLDALFSLSVIDLQLMGLGFGTPLKWPIQMPPEFYLEGLSLSYRKDPIEISGSLIKVRNNNPDLLEFYGAVVIKMATFKIIGIGAYSQKKIYSAPNTKEHSIQHSMFIYGAYMGAIGGPAFLFVTGIAIGFGYNRKIRTPNIDEVKDFPLVSVVLSSDKEKGINQILQELIAKQWIPESAGDYWFAIGLKFTTFKIVDSFVLVIVQFGTRTEFCILGLSILAWPTKDMPVAYVEMALRAYFAPDAEAISIEAKLTENSFLFHPSCRLTGGFAFYSWIAGEHEGDFVITLGGYHPKFPAPTHYPRVERVGLNWKLSDKLLIKGGVYYALTPSFIMAGGSLEIAYDLGFLKASIYAWMDLIIGWAPFRYKAEIGILVKIRAQIKVCFFKTSFDVEIGALLQLWGPPFAGLIKVKWPIYSFSISFGESPDKISTPLQWQQFKEQFIPAKKDKNDNQQYFAAEIMLTDGLIKEYKIGNRSVPVVNPNNFCLKIEAPIPLTEVKVNNSVIAADTPMLLAGSLSQYNSRNLSLGIKPMGETRLNSTLSITINGVQSYQLNLECMAGGVPGALWSQQTALNTQTPQAPEVLPNALKGIFLKPQKNIDSSKFQALTLNESFYPISRNIHPEEKTLVNGYDNASIIGSAKAKITELLQQENRHIESSQFSIIQAAIASQEMIPITTQRTDLTDWTSQLRGEPIFAEAGSYPQYPNR